MAHCLKPGADCTIQGLPHRSSCAVRSVICSNKSQHSRQRLRYRRACSDDLSGGLAPHAEALEISAHAPSTAISRRQLIGRAAVLAACSCGACIGQAHPAAAAAEPYTPPFTYGASGAHTPAPVAHAMQSMHCTAPIQPHPTTCEDYSYTHPVTQWAWKQPASGAEPAPLARSSRP